MSVSYKGKSPGALWYGLQHTKGFFKSFANYGTKKEAQTGAKNVGFMAASLVGGGMVAGIGAFAVVPLLPSFISLIAIYAAFHFGLKAVRNFATVKNSSSHYSYIMEQEQKWLDKKNSPSLLKRLFGSKPKADANRRAAQKDDAPISKGNVFGLDKSNSPLSREGWSFDFNDKAADAPAQKEPAAQKPANGNAPAQKPGRKWNRRNAP
jgi:hypothetical protein